MLRKLTTAMVLMGAAGMASAATISYNFNLPESGTEINQTGSLNLFDPSQGTLNGVTFYVDGAATTNISLTNNAGQDQTVRATGTVDLSYNSSISALNSFLASNANPGVSLSLPTGNQTIARGATYTSGNLTGSGQSTTWTTTTGLSNSWFQGTGTFNVGCTSLSGLLLQGGGGQVDSTQATTAGCSAHVTYDYTPTPPAQVPEPATLGLMGLGLAGLGVWRRRKV